jgi:hypothetical protein
MTRARGSSRSRRRLAAPFDQLPLPPSQTRALSLATFGCVPDETADPHSRYEVLLADDSGARQATFFTSVFSGPDRVDLEDACELGGYETVVVRRRRGRFGAREAARRLQEIIDDLTYEYGHDLQFFVLDATPHELQVRLYCDFEGVVRTAGRAFRAALEDVLGLCGFEPAVECRSRGWLELAIGPKEARGRLLVPLGAAPARAIPAQRPRRGALTVLVRPQDDPPESTDTIRYLHLSTFVRELHRGRIETLEMMLREVERPARGKSRRGQV